MSIELKQAAQQALEALLVLHAEGARVGWHLHPKWEAQMRAASDSINTLRTAIQQAEARTDEPVLPDGYVVAPHFRGYARLGIGAYLINHSAPGHEPELVISVATEDEKAGRSVGEDQDNAPGSEIQPEQIAVRLCFENVAGLDALEKQLRYLREVHFSGTHPAPGVPEFSRIAKRKLDELQEQGFAITGYAIQRGTKRGFITDGGFVGWWRSDEAPSVFLVRDVASLLRASVPDVCNALAELGYEPRRSTNAAISPDEAIAVAKRLNPAPGVPDDVARDAERCRTFLATRPSNTHEVVNDAIDAAMLAAKDASA